MLKVGDVRKSHCGFCAGERNCKVRGAHSVSEDDNGYWWRNTWYILECRGCEHVFVQKVHMNSEEYTHEDLPNGEWETVPITTDTYWPAINSRPKPEWVFAQSIDAEGADGLGEMLPEVYDALQSDHVALAAIGIRTCFDLAAEALAIDPDLSFERKLKALEEAKCIGALDVPRLRVLVDAGSATAHRGWRPTKRQIDDMMDILEHFIFHSLVEPQRRKKLDEKAVKMAEGVPKRRARGKRKSQTAGDTAAKPIASAPADPNTALPKGP